MNVVSIYKMESHRDTLNNVSKFPDKAFTPERGRMSITSLTVLQKHEHYKRKALNLRGGGMGNNSVIYA